MTLLNVSFIVNKKYMRSINLRLFEQLLELEGKYCAMVLVPKSCCFLFFFQMKKKNTINCYIPLSDYEAIEYSWRIVDRIDLLLIGFTEYLLT